MAAARGPLIFWLLHSRGHLGRGRSGSLFPWATVLGCGGAHQVLLSKQEPQVSGQFCCPPSMPCWPEATPVYAKGPGKESSGDPRSVCSCHLGFCGSPVFPSVCCLPVSASFTVLLGPPVSRGSGHSRGFPGVTLWHLRPASAQHTPSVVWEVPWEEVRSPRRPC